MRKQLLIRGSGFKFDRIDELIAHLRAGTGYGAQRQLQTCCCVLVRFRNLHWLYVIDDANNFVVIVQEHSINCVCHSNHMNRIARLE